MSKFHVSYEASMLLREKGYNEVVESYYDTLGELNEVRSIFKNSVADNSFLHSFGDYYAAPTKAEAIDWLESKGVYVEIHGIGRELYRRYCYTIFAQETGFGLESKYIYQTRLEAEEAAIIKALELLNRKEE